MKVGCALAPLPGISYVKADKTYNTNEISQFRKEGQGNLNQIYVLR